MPVTPTTPARWAFGLGFWLWPLLSASLVVLGVWYLAVGPGGLEAWILPPPHDALGAIVANPAMFWFNASGTLRVIALAVPLSLVLGVLLGGAAALIPRVGNAIWALLVLAQALPIFALGPVIAVLVGDSLTKSLFIACSILVFPVALSFYRGLRAIDADLIDAGRLDAPNLAMLGRWVLWPLSLPSLFGGLRAAMTIAPMAAVIAEFAGTERGLSRVIIKWISLGQMDKVWGAVLCLVIMALGVFGIGALLERIAVPWSFVSTQGSIR